MTTYKEDELSKAKSEFTFHELCSIRENLNRETSALKDIIHVPKYLTMLISESQLLSMGKT